MWTKVYHNSFSGLRLCTFPGTHVCLDWLAAWSCASSSLQCTQASPSSLCCSWPLCCISDLCLLPGAPSVRLSSFTRYLCTHHSDWYILFNVHSSFFFFMYLQSHELNILLYIVGCLTFTYMATVFNFISIFFTLVTWGEKFNISTFYFLLFSNHYYHFFKLHKLHFSLCLFFIMLMGQIYFTMHLRDSCQILSFLFFRDVIDN